MQLHAEVAQVQRRQHVAVRVGRQQHRHRLAQKAHTADGPCARAAVQLEQAFAGGDPARCAM